VGTTRGGEGAANYCMGARLRAGNTAPRFTSSDSVLCDGRVYGRSFPAEERSLIDSEQKEEDRFMSEPTKPESKPDDLTKTTEPNSIELTEEDLKRVSGGDAKHKNEIQL